MMIAPALFALCAASAVAAADAFLNQAALHVHDPAVTERFYTENFGLQRIVKHEEPVGEFSLTLLGPPSLAGGNASTTFSGLVELIWSKKWANEHAHDHRIPAAKAGLSHIGITVPDAAATQARLAAAGAPILKRLGKEPAPDGPLAVAFGVDGEPKVAAAAFRGLDPLGFDKVFHVADPEGIVVEVGQAP